MYKNFDLKKKKVDSKIQGHTYRPFEDLEKILREKGLYPKIKK